MGMNKLFPLLTFIIFTPLALGASKECVKYLKDKEGKVVAETKEQSDSNADACLRAHEACLKKKENLLRSKVYPADPGLFCSFDK